MNKEKTAIQMLIENIDSRLKNYASYTLRYSLETCRNEAKSLLKKEQDQIEKAFDKGYERGGSLLFVNGEPDEGSEYYNSKYGGDNG